MSLCPVCSEECQAGIFAHFESRSKCDLHRKYLLRAVEMVEQYAEDCYVYEMFDNLKDIPLMNVDFIRACMLKLGYNPRKKVNTKRSRATDFIAAKDLTKSDFSSLFKEGVAYIDVHRAVANQHELLKYYVQHTVCLECGKEIKSADLQIRVLNETNPILSDLFPTCPDCFSIRSSAHKVSVTKEFFIAAAHHLPNYNGLCYFSHGHEWKLHITIKDYVSSSSGMIIDFSKLKKIVNEHIVNVLDHNFINDVLYNPTAENMVAWIWDTLMVKGNLKGIERIDLWEAPSSFATLSRENVYTILNK